MAMAMAAGGVRLAREVVLLRVEGLAKATDWDDQVSMR
jgi:hypothetical protein